MEIYVDKTSLAAVQENFVCNEVISLKSKRQIGAITSV